MLDSDIQQKVRQFYDGIGWQTTDSGFYQNARYEDLRPVAAEYIHKCHMRINRFLQPQGRFLLDAGSGPIQYPEYLSYSQGYNFRVCVDLSIVALHEARRRISDHGLFVVADVSHLPFCLDAFDGAVSLHTFHHLPIEQQKQAYLEINRVLKRKCTAVVVNGWTDSPLMGYCQWLVSIMEFAASFIIKIRKKYQPNAGKQNKKEAKKQERNKIKEPVGTYIQKMSPDWLRKELSGCFSIQIWVWRSVNVRFLRAIVHDAFGGRLFLKLLYALEEKFPHFFGEKGQYPLIVMEKTGK